MVLSLIFLLSIVGGNDATGCPNVNNFLLNAEGETTYHVITGLVCANPFYRELYSGQEYISAALL